MRMATSAKTANLALRIQPAVKEASPTSRPRAFCRKARREVADVNGETSFECIVHDVDDDHAIIMESDENLARSEIQGADRPRRSSAERCFG
jgi:hypothetical protein